MQFNIEVVQVSKSSLKKQGYSSFQEWVSNEENLYVGGSCAVKGCVKSEWENPFENTPMDKKMALMMYKCYILDDINKMIKLHNIITEGKIKKLGCWCNTNASFCHASFLARYGKELAQNFNIISTTDKEHMDGESKETNI
jgi:hypothetical protein